MQGQVWRLVTFIFIPSASSPIALLLGRSKQRKTKGRHARFVC